jgi:hypothetical protein
MGNAISESGVRSLHLQSNTPFSFDVDHDPIVFKIVRFKAGQGRCHEYYAFLGEIIQRNGGNEGCVVAFPRFAAGVDSPKWNGLTDSLWANCRWGLRFARFAQTSGGGRD